MYDIEENGGTAQEGTADFFRGTVPPLRLAGIDEDDLAEPHVVRGID